jgi:hypothetical protein
MKGARIALSIIVLLTFVLTGIAISEILTGTTNKLKLLWLNIRHFKMPENILGGP